MIYWFLNSFFCIEIYSLIFLNTFPMRALIVSKWCVLNTMCFFLFFLSGVIQCLFFLTCLVFMKILWIMQIFSNPSIYQSNAFSFRQIGVYLLVSSFSGSQLFQTLPLPFPSGRAAIQSCCMSVFQGCFFCCTRRIFFIPLPDSMAWHLCPVSFFFLFPGVLIFFRNFFDEFLGIFPKLLGQSSLGKPQLAGWLHGLYLYNSCSKNGVHIIKWL